MATEGHVPLRRSCRPNVLKLHACLGGPQTLTCWEQTNRSSRSLSPVASASSLAHARTWTSEASKCLSKRISAPESGVRPPSRPRRHLPQVAPDTPRSAQEPFLRSHPVAVQSRTGRAGQPLPSFRKDGLGVASVHFQPRKSTMRKQTVCLC